MMPRDQETSIDQAPPASSDPFRTRPTGPDDVAADDTVGARPETAGSEHPHRDLADGTTGPADATEPAPEGEWVAGSRDPSATVPSQPGSPAAEDVRGDRGTRATPPFGEQAVPATGEDRSPADRGPADRSPAGGTISTADTTPDVDADSDPSVATPPAMDADASPATETRSGTGALPATDTAQLDQPATGAHAVPADAAPGGTGAGLNAVGAAFVTDAQGYRASWVRIQSAFVDDPHGSVTEAADLIAQITSTLVSAVQERERSLRGGWESGGADTEVLRNALREYRSFFERLMKV
jgi:hypothetical protein